MIADIVAILAVLLLAFSAGRLVSRRWLHPRYRASRDVERTAKRLTVSLIGMIQLAVAALSRPDSQSRVSLRVPRPSLSGWLVRGAVRRLPTELGEAERGRWAEEMKADVASVEGRLRRLRYAFGLWRKGAPGMPAAGHYAPRSVD